jgi:hypothetical protein
MSPTENPLPVGDVLFIIVFLKYLPVSATEVPLEFAPTEETAILSNVALVKELPPAVLCKVSPRVCAPVELVYPKDMVYGFKDKNAELVGYPPASLVFPCLRINSFPLLN